MEKECLYKVGDKVKFKHKKNSEFYDCEILELNTVDGVEYATITPVDFHFPIDVEVNRLIIDKSKIIETTLNLIKMLYKYGCDDFSFWFEKCSLNISEINKLEKIVQLQADIPEWFVRYSDVFEDNGCGDSKKLEDALKEFKEANFELNKKISLEIYDLSDEQCYKLFVYKK